jgi:SAM-dependent methyltransferase
VSDEPWYRSWFGKEYLDLYPHRDHREAEGAVELLLERVAFPEGAPVLDLGCGGGRHLRALQARGVRAVGLDLSAELLAAAHRLVPGAPLVRGDMRRLPFAGGSFRVVTSFFTSFGYFETEEEDRQVVAEARRVLRPGGTLLLDFLNAREVRRNLTPRDVQTLNGREVVQERRLIDGGRRVEKEIRILGGEGEAEARFRERVRLYEMEELDGLLTSEGFHTLARLGDYGGRPVHDASPRVILLARSG